MQLIGVLAALIFIVGAMFTVIVPVMVLIVIGDARTRRKVARMRLIPCADVAQLANGRRTVIVEGRLAPGPDGLLTAPLSGTPCLWYSSRAHRRTPETEDSSGRHTMWSERRTANFTVVDASGSILVDPAVLAAPAPSGEVLHDPTEGVIAEFSKPEQLGPQLTALLSRGLVTERQLKRGGWLSATIGYDVIESVILPDAHVVVRADPVRRDGQVMLTSRKGRHFLHHGKFADIAPRVAEDGKASWGLLGFFAVAGPTLAAFGWFLGLAVE